MASSLPALPFFRVAFKELLDEPSSLVVFAKGLGVRVLLCRLIRFYSELDDLVFVINGLHESATLLSMLESDGAPPRRLPRVLDSNTPAAERRRAMAQGGVIFASTQQLIVDLLQNRLEGCSVRGLVVFDAHRVTDSSKEGLLIRTFKARNPSGFVKALSDDADFLTKDFSRLQQTMRALHVRTLSLWPRFHDLVRKDLDKLPRLANNRGGQETVELSPLQSAVHRTIIAAMDAVVADIAATSSLDVGDLTRSNALFSNFDDLVGRKFNSSTVGIKLSVKNALGDLSVLRKLLFFLVQHDAVSFYDYLVVLRNYALTDKRTSDWILSSRGQAVITAARDRVYKIVPIDAPSRGRAQPAFALGFDALHSEAPVTVSERVREPAAGTSRASAVPPQPSVRQFALHLVLEPNPKWERFVAIVHEAVAAASAPGPGGAVEPGAAVLVVTRNARTCGQLREVLAHGHRALLEDMFVRSLRRNAMSSASVRGSVTRAYRAALAAHPHALEPRASPRMDAKCNVCRVEIAENALSHVCQPCNVDICDACAALARGGGAGGGAAAPTPLAWFHSPDFSGLSEDEHSLLTAADVLSVPPPPGVLAPFVAVEQRLLWKQLARFYSQRQRDDAVCHERLGGVRVRSLAAAEVRGPGGALPRTADHETGAMLVDAFGALAARGIAGLAKLDVADGFVAGSTTARKRVRASDDGQVGSARAAADIVSGDDEADDFALRPPTFPGLGAGAGTGAGGGAGGSAAAWLPREKIVFFATNDLERHPPVLPDLRPRAIILYESDPSFLREIELYATSPLAPPSIALFTLGYEGGAEGVVNATLVKKEREAFVRLITEKKTMAPPPLPTTRQEMEAVSGSDASLITRRTGPDGAVDAWGITVKPRAGFSAAGLTPSALLLGAAPADIPRVIVDIRELRSQLPSLLDMGGIQIDPVTLEVGDYILTPDVCVERKSVPDLTQSLSSGRLFKQAVAMSRHYRQPMLLIEFDGDRPFELVPDAPVPNEVLLHDLRSKLVLLLLHFPALRLLWARSARSTVKIFKALKMGMPQPNRDTAVGITYDDEEEDGRIADQGAAVGAGVTAFAGVGEGVGLGTAAARCARRREGNNTVAIDLLRKLPGVTMANSRALMIAVPSLAALATMSVAALTPFMGASNAAALHSFLNQPYHAGAP